jgi:hypothetical protein
MGDEGLSDDKCTRGSLSAKVVKVQVQPHPVGQTDLLENHDII